MEPACDVAGVEVESFGYVGEGLLAVDDEVCGEDAELVGPVVELLEAQFRPAPDGAAVGSGLFYGLGAAEPVFEDEADGFAPDVFGVAFVAGREVVSGAVLLDPEPDRGFGGFGRLGGLGAGGGEMERG